MTQTLLKVREIQKIKKIQKLLMKISSNSIKQVSCPHYSPFHPKLLTINTKHLREFLPKNKKAKKERNKFLLRKTNTIKD